MATTTFSGPIKAGTIKDTIGTTVGTNVANTGFVTMAQSIIVDITGASALNQRVAIVPANSQIIDVILNVTTANTDSGAATVSVGTAADANAFLDVVNVGTTDLEVLADFTGANGDGTGAGTVTVMYLQNNNLS